MKLLSWISEKYRDPEDPTLARLLAVPVLFATYLIPIGIWAVASWKVSATGHLAEVPGTLIGLIGTISGPLLAFLYGHSAKPSASTPSTS